MRKALTRAAHVLAAAGTLGFVYPAVAQSSLGVHPPITGIVVRTSAMGATHEAEAPATSEGKLAELQVEAALLANPSTFGYALAAHPTSAGLELRGFVPDKLVKEQALEIAQKHCKMPVLDKLQINATLEVRTPTGTAEEMQQSAVALLTEHFDKIAAGLDVQAVGTGRLAIHGSCESYEQLVEISKTLRSVNGCCAVDNHLIVKPTMHDGRMVTLVTADGSLTLPTTPLETPPMSRQAFAESNVPPAPRVAITPPTVVNSKPKPSSIELPPTQPSRMDTLPPMVAKADVIVPPLPLPKADPLTTAPKQPDLPPVKPLPVLAKTDARTPTIPPPKVDPLATAPMKQDLPPVKPLPPITPVVTPIATSMSTSGKSTVVAASLSSTAAPIGQAPVSPLANVSAYAKEPGPGWETKTSAVEHLAPPPEKPTPPPAGWAKAYEKPQTAQVDHATKGLVVFDEDLPEPAPALGKDKASQLKQKVVHVCGNKAKEVAVETRADGKLHVIVKVASQTENEDLTFKILGIEEMASWNVQLHVELAK